LSWFVRNEDWRTYLKRYPINSLFIFLNILIFLLMTFDGGSTRTRTLIEYGAYFKPLILEGEFYRFITPIFIHIGWEHLLFNCFALLIFAPGLELILGKLKYTALCLITGSSGFIATFLFAGEHVIAAGASGAIFGIYGLYAFLTQHRKDILDYHSRQIIMPILIFGVIFTFVIPGISVTGHIGGLISGYLLGYLFIRSQPKQTIH
jgi:rhomboid protease GluP